MKKILLFSLAVISSIPAHADLPSLQNDEWSGVFAGFENRSIRFTMSASGTLLVEPFFDKKKIFPYVNIPIEVTLEETLGNGTTKNYPVIPVSLESSDKPTNKLKQVDVRGKFEGGAVFEISVSEKGEALLLTGKLTDYGDFKKRKVRLRIAAEVLNFYGNDEEELAKNPRAFSELVSKSQLTLSTKKRKEDKMDFSESLDSDRSKNADLTEAEVVVDTLKGKKFNFAAEGASSMYLEPRHGLMLHRGFFVAWSPEDSEKTSGGDIFSISVK